MSSNTESQEYDYQNLLNLLKKGEGKSSKNDNKTIKKRNVETKVAKRSKGRKGSALIQGQEISEKTKKDISETNEEIGVNEVFFDDVIYQKDAKPAKSARKSLNFSDAIKAIKECKFIVITKNNDKVASVTFVFHPIRLITLNEMFAALQVKNWGLFKYKQACKELINKSLSFIDKNQLPVFDNKVSVYYYREANRYIDQDSLPASFKYFLDGIVKNNVKQMLSDDNPNVIEKIIPVQVKNSQCKNGKNIVAIKIEMKKDKNNSSDCSEEGFVNEIQSLLKDDFSNVFSDS